MQLIPLNLLDPWSENPRSEMNETAIERLKSSIESHRGLIQSLVVVPGENGRYTVIAGAQRFQALLELAREGKISPDTPQPCIVRPIRLDDAEALRIALAENDVRAEMDLIDVCFAMAELARKGETIDSIAAAFGYTTKSIRQNIALGRLPEEARKLVKNRVRDRDWAQAMTACDAATQARILADISNNPESWKDGAMIRRHISSEAIPAEHALFDIELYKAQVQGGIIHDLFDGDKLTDRAAFWELQNRAIADLQDALRAEGWRSVTISHQPVDLWRYTRSADQQQAIAIIEVIENGRVTVHRGLVAPEETAAETPDQDGATSAAADEEIVPIAGDAVRATGAVLEYAAAHRTAMVQAALAADVRKAMEVVLAGLLGHTEIPIRSQDYQYGLNQDARTSGAFDEVAARRDALHQAMDKGGVQVSGKARDIALLQWIASLDDDGLQKLFATAVANKIGQAAKRLDGDPNSLINQMGVSMGINPRASWTPDKAFFATMGTSDLRRLAQALLPVNRQAGLLTAKKANLVAILVDAFADARDGCGTLDPVTADRLNRWVPGVMRFPAQEDVPEPVAETTVDPFAAVFGRAA